jgi:pSer/pThr/pTyr-binding forkhead associated (FHA) protein
MASLLITSQGFENQVIQLKLGITRVGRSPKNDFRIDHDTVSAAHCELVLSDGELVLRDCDSTNGSFVGDERIQEAQLQAGQTVRLGDIELLVETTEVVVAIPKFDRPLVAPPVVLTDGSLLCPRHPRVRATHQCTKCREILCDACVHRLRRRGGKILKLCPICSGSVEIIGGEKPKKKTLLDILNKTVKLPFVRLTKGKRTAKGE